MTDKKKDKENGEEQPLSDAEKLLADFARKTDTVEIEPGRFIECRAVGLGGRMALSEHKGGSVDATFAALVVYGCPVFAGLDPIDLEARLDPVVLQKLATKVMDLSGMGAKAEAEAEKNSESDPS